MPACLQPVAVVDVDLVAVAVALADLGRCAVDRRTWLPGSSDAGIGAEAHGAAQVAVGLRRSTVVAAGPFGHQADDRVVARPELGRAGALHARPGCAPPRSPPSACRSRCRNRAPCARARTGRGDLALDAALAEAAGHQDAVDALQVMDGPFVSKISESSQRMLTLVAVLAMPPWVSASARDL